jgi:hypothetical protein
MQAVWTPADAEALRRDIAAHPAIIGQSVILSLIVGAEGITL